MSKVLCSTTEVYRVDTQEEVDSFINEVQESSDYELTGYAADRKITKDDEYFKVTVKKKFNDLKNPTPEI